MRLVLRTKIHVGWVVEGKLGALTRSQRQGLRDVSLSLFLFDLRVVSMVITHVECDDPGVVYNNQSRVL